MSVESLLAALDDAAHERVSGAVVVGGRQAFLFLLMGEPQHAVVPAVGSAGAAALADIGRLAAAGLAVAWSPDEPLVPGRSLAGMNASEVRAAILSGALMKEPVMPVAALSQPAQPDVAASPQEAQRGAEMADVVAQPAAAPAAVPRAVDDAMPDGAVEVEVPTASVPKAATAVHLPPFPAGAPVVSADVGDVHIDTLLAAMRRAMVILESGSMRGLALFADGDLQDALCAAGGELIIGADAWRVLCSRDRGTWTVSVIDATVQRALPVLWRGERRFIDVPASMINIDRLTATLCREPGPAAIVVRSATGDGVSILAGNSLLTSYATNGSFDDAVAAPDARLEVRASPPVSGPDALTAPPAAENPEPSGEVDLQPAVDEMCRLVHERLHQHGGALEQAIRSSSRTRDELRKLAQHVRDMSIRGITPATMSEISRELAQVVERV